MSKFTKIYLDLDGVLADFHKKFEETFGEAPIRYQKNKDFYDKFDIFIKNKSFANLDMMPDAKDLLAYLKTIEVPIEILSSTAFPAVHNEITYQKEIWLKKHHITYPAIFVPGKKNKKNFADETSILIDDTESNIDDWKQAGGTAILHKDALTTILNLDTLLNI
jgi:FMN phosphatase YigB (HAD superfamily)